MTTAPQMTREDVECRKDIGLTRTLPQNVMTAIFACPSCNWPLVASMFTEHGQQDDLREFVFELTCGQCKWSGAVLGRDIVDCMIDDWTSHEVRGHQT